MSTQTNPIPAVYWWFTGVCIVGFGVTWYELLDAEITMRWARNQYEIHEETAMGISGLIWFSVFMLFVGLKVFISHVRSPKSGVA